MLMVNVNGQFQCENFTRVFGLPSRGSAFARFRPEMAISDYPTILKQSGGYSTLIWENPFFCW